MPEDTKLEKQVSEYAALAKENPNIDAASLMINAMSQQGHSVSPRAKHWAYLISIGMPPLGLLFALKYYVFSDEDDAKTVALICIALTVVSVAFFWLIGSMMLSGSGTSLQQIQQINPKMIQQTLQ